MCEDGGGTQGGSKEEAERGRVKRLVGLGKYESGERAIDLSCSRQRPVCRAQEHGCTHAILMIHHLLPCPLFTGAW